MNNKNINPEYVKMAEKVVEEGVKSIFNNDKDVENINKLTPDKGYLASIELIKEDDQLSLREKIDLLSELDDQKQDRISRSVRTKREIMGDKLMIFANILQCGVSVLALGVSTYKLIKR